VSTLMRSSSCGQRGACRCWIRPIPEPSSATACRTWRPAIGPSRVGRSSRLPGQVGARLRTTSRSPRPAIGSISATADHGADDDLLDSRGVVPERIRQAEGSSRFPRGQCPQPTTAGGTEERLIRMVADR
jgi:hypothetical protein